MFRQKMSSASSGVSSPITVYYGDPDDDHPRNLPSDILLLRVMMVGPAVPACLTDCRPTDSPATDPRLTGYFVDGITW